MKSNKFMESFLQKWRFEKAIPFVKGKSILDFGGNKGELKGYVNQKYFLCNKNYSILKEQKFDNVVLLAVIEHIPFEEVFKIIKMLKKHLNNKGRLIITAPTKRNKFILEFLAKLNLLDRENIKEHKHYWSKKELFKLAEENGFSVRYYKKFQLGLNQIIVSDLF